MCLNIKPHFQGIILATYISIIRKMLTDADIQLVLPSDGMENDSRKASSTKRQKTDSIIGGVSSFADMNCHHIEELLDSHIDAISKPWKAQSVLPARTLPEAGAQSLTHAHA